MQTFHLGDGGMSLDEGMAFLRSTDASGLMIRFELSNGVHVATEPLRFDESVVASQVIILGSASTSIVLPPAAAARRRVDVVGGVPAAAIILRSELKLKLRGLTLQGGSHADGIGAIVVDGGGELAMQRCTAQQHVEFRF